MRFRKVYGNIWREKKNYKLCRKVNEQFRNKNGNIQGNNKLIWNEFQMTKNENKGKS